MVSSVHPTSRMHRADALRAYVDGFDQSFYGSVMPEPTHHPPSSGSSCDPDTPRTLSIFSASSDASTVSASTWTTVPADSTHTETAPSTRTPVDPLDQDLLHAPEPAQPTDNNPTDPASPPSPFLACEFSRYDGCTTTFPADEQGLAQLIEHIASHHLQYNFPPHCLCWWCDDFAFDTTDPRSGGDRARNFANRMAHIRSHVSDAVQAGSTTSTASSASSGGTGGGGALSRVEALYRRRRADYYMVDHLRSAHLIDDRTFDAERSIREAPCPEGIYPAGWRPAVPERAVGVQHDLAGEERQRRRQERGIRGRGMGGKWRGVEP